MIFGEECAGAGETLSEEGLKTGSVGARGKARVQARSGGAVFEALVDTGADVSLVVRALVEGNGWEPRNNMGGCQRLMEEFEKRVLDK